MTEPRTIVITGAGTGIGAACARLYAAEGAHVVLIGRRREPLEQVARETGGLVLVGDAACPQTWEGFIAQIRSRTIRMWSPAHRRGSASSRIRPRSNQSTVAPGFPCAVVAVSFAGGRGDQDRRSLHRF